MNEKLYLKGNKIGNKKKCSSISLQAGPGILVPGLGREGGGGDPPRPGNSGQQVPWLLQGNVATNPFFRESYF